MKNIEFHTFHYYCSLMVNYDSFMDLYRNKHKTLLFERLGYSPYLISYNIVKYKIQVTDQSYLQHK